MVNQPAHDRTWLTEVVNEHLITAHEQETWVPVAATQHITNTEHK